MGYFNARVGFRRHSSLSGEHQVGASDAVGPVAMANGCQGTFFNHAHYGSWMHARTKLWHHIDHVLVPARTMRMVLDVKTMPGIGFDTDHRMIRMRFRFLRERGMGSLGKFRQPWPFNACRFCKFQGLVRRKQRLLI